MVNGPKPRPVGAIDLAVFLVELAMLAVLAVAGVRLGTPAITGIVLAVLLPLVAAILWGRYLAPRASRRLPYPGRVVAKLALIMISSALLGVSGATAWAITFLVIGGTLFTIGELMGQDRNGSE